MNNLPTETCFRSESCEVLKTPNKYKVSNKKITIHKPMNTSRVNIPACTTRSALDANFKANANSMNPSVTFTAFNQPPDCGNEFNQPGNAANNPKGNASAKAKPNIPQNGPPKLPVPAASTRRVPMIGPVQENDTKARV